MSFAAGFQLGNRMVGEIEESRRQKMLDERAAKEFARKEQEWSRADKDREAVDAAFSNLNNVQMGLNTDAQKQIQSTYGMTPAQISQAGGIEGLKTKLASYDVPDAHELQNVPDATTTGVRPRFDASQVKVSAPSRSDSLRALQGVAIAKRDATSAASIGEQLRTAEDDDFIASALKGYTGAPEQIGGAAAYLNTNSKRVTMGAPDKNGFVRLSVVGTDGGAEFLKLNRQDQARLYAAAQLMERNPARAIEIMSSVNKELASAIAQENGLVGTEATNANDVASKSGNLSVAQQNANTMEMYRRQLGGAASARAAGGANGRPVKMDVETLDPVTGKKTKVQVLMNPSTGEAVTADGRPFKDSAALDRAMGVMNQESQLGAAEANDLRLIEEQFKSGSIAPTKGQTPMQALDAARNEVRQIYAARRGALAFSQLDEDEKVNTLRKMANASGKDAEQIASLVGADPKYVKNVLDSGNKTGGMPPPKAGSPRKADPLQSAYEDWQNAKGSWLTNWFRQRGPGAAEAEREAEARYTEMLRNQYGK